MKTKIARLVMEVDENGWCHGELIFPFRERGHRLVGSCGGSIYYVKAWFEEYVRDFDMVFKEALSDIQARENVSREP
jgi:hypothetical protein